ncbi:hypothetical protein TRICI_000120 [Trichomonascus ciferrii]|uniref:Enoyl reductase (ER) domain-containing protein n=1 Tax=Trichomonascus ciferrii TaxID=44093 RepID=A0A642VED2_9ASCO|nr:hypothetical protein TRICI_000120 [Trichomonascus ciferrii]
MTIPTKQKGYVYDSDKGKLEMREIPVPQPKPNQVLLKVEGGGMCHSDLHIICGDNPLPGKYVMGHEIAASVVLTGAGVDESRYPKGKLFAFYGPNGCGSCSNCRKGYDNQCQTHKNYYGLGIDGGYQEYIVADPRNLIPVPDGVSAPVAAATTDAVLTPYHAARRAGITTGDTVLVFGLGGLGINAVQVAKYLGAKVIACDLREEQCKKARSLGADVTYVNLPESPLNVDVVLDVVGHRDTFYLAQKHVRPRGKIVPVGLASTVLEINQHPASQREIEIISTFWGTSAELMECLDLVAKGVVNPQVETCHLEDVHDILHKLEHNKIKSRTVIVPKL